jgi:hypothetical protein
VHSRDTPLEIIQEDFVIVDAVISPADDDLVLAEAEKNDCNVTTTSKSPVETPADQTAYHAPDNGADLSSPSRLRPAQDFSEPLTVYKCETTWEHVCIPQWVSWEVSRKLVLQEHFMRMDQRRTNNDRVLTFRDDKRSHKMFARHDMGKDRSPLSNELKPEGIV